MRAAQGAGGSCSRRVIALEETLCRALGLLQGRMPCPHPAAVQGTSVLNTGGQLEQFVHSEE